MADVDLEETFEGEREALKVFDDVIAKARRAIHQEQAARHEAAGSWMRRWEFW